MFLNYENIEKITNYANKHFLEANISQSNQDIMKQAYERWAIDEILLEMMEHPMTDAGLLIERFILKVEFFLCMSENPTNNFIFKVAGNTAKKLLGLIL